MNSLLLRILSYQLHFLHLHFIGVIWQISNQNLLVFEGFDHAVLTKSGVQERIRLTASQIHHCK